MATTKTEHGQMSKVDDNGNVIILYSENSASDVTVDRTANTAGEKNASAIPSDIDNLQKLVNKMGSLAFKTKLNVSDIQSGEVTQDLDVTSAGKVLDARVGKELNDRLTDIEDDPLLCYDESGDTDVGFPETEINDSFVSKSLTWSSKKLSDELTQLDSNSEYRSKQAAENLETEKEARAVLEARVNVLTQLPTGSTSGDAELMDIRVGDNGKTYSSAGEAVRGQFKDVKKSIEDNATLIDTDEKYLDTQGIDHLSTLVFTKQQLEYLEQEMLEEMEYHRLDMDSTMLHIRDKINQYDDEISELQSTTTTYIDTTDKSLDKSDMDRAMMAWQIMKNSDESSSDLLDALSISAVDIATASVMAMQAAKKAEAAAATTSSESSFAYTGYVNNDTFPVMYFTGTDFSTMNSSKNKVTLEYTFKSQTGNVTTKWQGSSSLGYPKHNFSASFDSKFEAKSGWGEQKKYVLKANYIDTSNARNIISARIWGQIAQSREGIPDRLKSLPNCGAIDGFPIMLVVNEKYWGLYTFNIPKDKWMLGITDEDVDAAILTGESSTNATRFTALEDHLGEDDSGWDLEYSAVDDDSDGRVLASINTLIGACIDCKTEDDYRNNVCKYVDVNSAIDYLCFCVLIGDPDQFGKNQIIFTLDMVKWIFNVYDLDTTFGNHWNGKSYYKITDTPTFTSAGKNGNGLMKLIYKYDSALIFKRYWEIREKVFNENNIMYMFTNFMNPIPKAVYDQDVIRWPQMPGAKTNDLAQILNYTRLRIEYIDAEVTKLQS